MLHSIDQQAALALHRPFLTGRHRAPTGGPARTNVRVGGEGTPSASAVALRTVSAAACARTRPAAFQTMEA